MDQFNAQAFLDMTMDQPLVKRPPIPVDDYIAVIGEPTIRPWVSPKDSTKSGLAVDFQLSIEVPAEVQAKLGLEQSTVNVKDGFILDLNASGGLDTSPGKNSGLRRYRDATGQNVPGAPFKISDLGGKVVKVKIGHREYPEGSGDLFEDVKGVAKA